MKTNNILFATVNNDAITERKDVNVLDVARLFANIVNRDDRYNAIVDSDCVDSRAYRDDYMHVYRHDTQNAQNRAFNNVFKCYFKHKKECVNIKCNKVNFDAFTCDIEHIKQYDKSEIRYIVSYDNFIAFMHSVIEFDNARATTSATRENVNAIAK